MGVNLSLYNKKSITPEQREFDIGRYVGDREFAHLPDFIECEYFEKNEYSIYWRPKNDIEFSKARGWIVENIPTGNQIRLLKLIYLLENDKNLYVTANY